MTAPHWRRQDPPLEPRAKHDDDAAYAQAADDETLYDSDHPASAPHGNEDHPVLKSHRKIADAAEGFDVSTRQKSWLLPAAFSLALLGVFAVAIFYAYSWSTGDVAEADLPVVTASNDPIKVRPENPGGLDVPHQDMMVLNEGDPAQEPAVERLLPPPEVPQPPPDEPAAYVPAPDDNVIASLVASEVLAGTAVDEGTSATEVQEPDTVASDPDQTPDTTIPGRKPETETNDSATSTPGANAAEGAAASASEAQAVAPVQTAQTPGSFVLQLASYRTEDAIAPAWTKLQNAHPDLLGDMQRFVQQAEVNGKTYYRLQVGPFPNRATALDVCAQLKASKQDCIVVKR